MNKLWLIIDCNFLCHRAKHTTQNLSFEGSATGVIYGVLRSILDLVERYETKHIIFCWDYGKGIREDIYPQYKANRKNRSEELSYEEERFENSFQKQVKKLRREYLKTIGFRNNFKQKGYEGDDVIASVVIHTPIKDDAIIISADKDLYQLISPTISMYNPITRKTMTSRTFSQKFGIKPKQWATVKALAGCTTDNVIGIKGVGELTAIKYLTNTLGTKGKIFSKIVDEEHHILHTNLPLVRLPLEGTKIFKLRKDKVTQLGWDCVIKKLGMQSLKKVNVEKLFR